jgi:diguanylate cyclase (GGDEF)-like protein/PAS domain S-box-containing protein
MVGTNQENEISPAISEALEIFKPYENFSKCLLDGYVIVNQNGRVVKANGLFGTMTGMKSRQILKAESFDEIISLNIGGNKLTVRDLLKAENPTRFDEVTGICQGKQGELNLIIGLFPLRKDAENHGAFVLMRDVTAEASLQDKYKEKATKSITDALTGLFNRNHFVEYLTETISNLEALPKDAPNRLCSVIMMDIDFFKKINDRFGHPAGDFVLKETSKILKNGFRKTDMIARYGGEEFLCVLPGTDLTGAVIAADKVRKLIEEFEFLFDSNKIPVSISSGVAMINIGGETGEQAITRADTALYHSKKNGRNQVTAHSGTDLLSGTIFTEKNSKPAA